MTPPASPASSRSEALAALEAALDRGRLRVAWEAAGTLGPPASWRETEERLVGAALLGMSGAPSGARRLEVRAHRDDRAHVGAAAMRAEHVLAYRGPVETLRELAAYRPEDATLPRHAARLWGWRARAHVALRDFDEADRCIEAGMRHDVEVGVLWFARAERLERDDRLEDALACAEEATRTMPWHGGVLQLHARQLAVCGRWRDAALVLERGLDDAVDVPFPFAMLASLRLELDDAAGALAALDRADVVAREVAEPPSRRWLAGLRSDALWAAGDGAGAAARAKEAGPGFFETVGPRLATASGARRRVWLAVPHVAQHHQTCAPATMAAIARYWNRSDSHLAIADEICFDGTPPHEQRAWAERAGLLVRELRVTWDTARALLDRGVPFAIAVANPPDAHMMAVAGYDEARGTLLLRDPSNAWRSEAEATGFFERYAWCGPRAMVCVPPAEAHRLEGLHLPDVEAYDALHRVDRALADGQVDVARDAVRALAAAHPDHALLSQAEIAIAVAEEDDARLLELASQRVEREPRDAWARVRVCEALRSLERDEERLGRIREAYAKEPSAMWAHMLAEACLSLPAARAEAPVWLRRARRGFGDRAPTLATRARIAWESRWGREALSLYRLAALGEPTHEGYVAAYARALQASGLAARASAELGARCARWGGRGAEPWRTHAWALETEGRVREAREVAARGLARHPGDAQLALALAKLEARLGEPAAHERLANLRARVTPLAWDRAEAAVRESLGDTEGALAALRRVAGRTPGSPEAHDQLARLVSVLEGARAAREHLASVAEKTGRPSLLRLAAQATSGRGAESHAAIDAVLAARPDDGWALRERALALIDEERFDVAAKALDAARASEPRNVANDAIASTLAFAAGRREEALTHARAALAWSPDQGAAAARLLATASEELRTPALLDEVLDAALARGTDGAALARWHDTAALVLSPGEVTARLDRARRERPDLYQATRLAVLDAQSRGDLDAARDLAAEATGRFPDEADAFRMLAAVHERRGEEALADAAHEEALARAGHSPLALAGAAQRLRERDPARAEALFARAAKIAPGGSWAVELARAELARGLAAQAVARLSRVLSLASVDEVAARAAEMLAVAQRGEIVEAWLRAAGQPACFADAQRLAAVAEAVDMTEVAHAAVARACAVEPRSPAAHDTRAMQLARKEAWAEAERACRPATFGEATPIALRGRAAWVVAQRQDLAAAIGRMRAVVRDDPSYAWGWSELCEWGRRAGDAPLALRAARELVWLRPDAPRLALAELACGDVETAIPRLARAARLNPEPALILPLAHHWLDVAQVDDAARALALAPDLDDPFIRFARLRVAALRGDDRAASAELAALARAPGMSAGMLTSARDTMIRSAQGDAAQAALEACLDDAAACETAGDLAMRVRLARHAQTALSLVDRRSTRSPAVIGAYKAWLTHRVREGKRWALLGAVLAMRARLRSHDRLWSNAGWALLEVGWRWPVRLWMHDWRARPGASPWALWNVASALRDTGAFRAAEEVSRTALERPEDHASPLHATWLAYEAAVSGRFDAARASPAIAAPQPPTPAVALPHALARAVLEVASAPPDERAAALLSARGSIASATAELASAALSDPRRAIVARAERRMAREVGTVGALSWGFRRELVFAGAVTLTCWLAFAAPDGASRSAALVSASIATIAVLRVLRSTP